jgi:hypothetical protein
MTYKLNLLTAFAAISITAGLFGATSPAYANRGEPDYRVVPVEAVSGTKIASDVAWRCTGDACTASNATSRPGIVCAKIVREVGKVSSFTYKGEALDAEALAKCNTRAR